MKKYAVMLKKDEGVTLLVAHISGVHKSQKVIGTLMLPSCDDRE